MTPLRRQLRSAARAYEAVRYPRDLAAEMLPADVPAARRSSSAATARPTFFRIAAPVSLISAAAALIAVAIILRPADSPRTPTVSRAQRPERDAHLVARLPQRAPAAVPVPAIHVPTLPRRVPEPLPQDIDVDAYRMRYDDLARQVPEVTPAIRRLTVPKLSDLPDRGLDWLQQVWTGDESA